MGSIQDNVKEQQAQNQKDTRFNINDSVWIAAAAMTYEIYYKKQNAGQPIYVPDFVLVQSDICNRTEVINGHRAEGARTSQWCSKARFLSCLCAGFSVVWQEPICHGKTVCVLR